MTEIQLKKLDDLYHSPEGYCGFATFWKLIKKHNYDESLNITKEITKDYYQSIPEVARFAEVKKPKHFKHILASYPNQTHQTDLIKMDSDTGPSEKASGKQEGFNYILSIVDVYTRYASGSAIKRKSGESLKDAINEAYKNTLLNFPDMLMVDEGKEFDNPQVKELLKEHKTTLLVNPTTNHNYTGVVERFNKSIEKRIFQRQGHVELSEADSSQTDKYRMYPKWVEFLQDSMYGYNHSPHRYLNGKTPHEAMLNPEKVIFKLSIGDNTKNGADILPINTTVKIEQFKKDKFNNRFMRETFSNKIFYIKDILLDNMITPLRYILVNDDDKTLPMPFYREELKVVNHIEVERVSKPKPKRMIIENEDETEDVPEKATEDVEKVTKHGRVIRKPSKLRD